MPLIYLFLVIVVAAIHPGLLLLGAVLWLLSIPGRRQAKVENAAVEMILFGTSATDRAVAAGRRRL